MTVLASVDTRLVLSPWMSVEMLDDTAATLYLSSDGTRIRVPLGLHRLLLRFTTATEPADVAGKDDLQGRIARAIGQLKDKGFLVPADAVPTVRPRQVTDPATRLFDVPAQKLVAARADVVVLGLPWDFGDRAAAGARHGPSVIREVSLQMLYGLDRRTGRPLGWFDADRRCTVLAGVSLADAGDVLVNHGERRMAVFERAGDVLRVLTRHGALPVTLGGDASTAYPVIEHSQRDDRLEVIRIGRPAAYPIPSSTALTADSLARHALALPFVDRYTQVVPRGASPLVDDALPGYVHEPVDTAMTAAPASTVSRRADEPRVHVGIDVDTLAHAGNTAPGASFTYADVHALLCRIGRASRIVSIDLCGMRSGGACPGAVNMTALHLLMTALSAAKDPP